MGKHRRPTNAYKPRTGKSLESSKGSLCPYCGKRSYLSRKWAKEAAKIQYPTEHLSAYRCVSAPEFADTSKIWHLGHLAEQVIHGRIDRGTIHGSPELTNPREPVKQPIPAVLRATMEQKTHDIIDATDDQGGTMPTIGETAVLNLRGFDRRTGGYKSISATSPTKDKVALVYGALRAYALTHSFEQMEEYGTDGYVGRVSVRSVCRELFETDELSGDNLDNLVKAITQAGNKAGLIRCVDSATRQTGVLPIWWVASDYEAVVGHAPLNDPAKRPAPPIAKKTPPSAPTPPPVAKAPAEAKPKTETLTASERALKGVETRKRKGMPTGRIPGTRNRARLEVMSLAERTLKELGRPVILDELYESANFPVAKGSLRDSLNELAKERRIIRRTLSAEDRKILKRAKGPKGLGPNTFVMTHVSLVPAVDGVRTVGPVTWGAAPVEPRKFGPPPGTTTPAVKPPKETKAQMPSSQLEAVPDDLDDVDAAIAAAEAKATAPKQSEEPARIAELEARVLELSQKLAKVTKQRDRLLAVVQTMGEDE